MPVYCQYKLPNSNMHRTKYHKHGANVYFEDTNVVLTGLLKQEEFREFLSGPPLEIEVHDRDRKPEPSPETPVTLGPDSHRLKQKTSGASAFGIAHLSLSELLTGQKRMEVNVPIKRCPPSQSARDNTGTLGAAHTQAMPQGDYVGANSVLKVKIELTCPLTKNASCDLEPCGGLFGRIIYLLHYNNVALMSKLRSEILRINASALQLGSGSLEEALFNYGINFRHNDTEDLDFVSGFHVMDEHMHVFVLEGLKHKAVKRLWESVPMR